MEARVDSILVVGTDTTVGSNLAAHWANGKSMVNRLAWAELEQSSGPAGLEAARGHLHATRPTRVVYCDSAGESAWSQPKINAETDARLRVWSRAVRETGCDFTYLSADAVFTGPWLFHVEDGTHHCHSLEAERLRTMEELVLRAVPDALLVRTHAFGWSADGHGWLERLLGQLEAGTAKADPVRHATPILVMDLADILSRAHEESATGVLHIAGAERVSHEGFVRRLAQQFGLPAPHAAWKGGLSGAMNGFGRGETSLRTNRVKNMLNLAMPMLGDGLERLAEQIEDGHQEQLREPAGAFQHAA